MSADTLRKNARHRHQHENPPEQGKALMRIQGIAPKLNSFIYTLATRREKSTTPNKRGRKWEYAARYTQSHERACITIIGRKEGAKIVEGRSKKRPINDDGKISKRTIDTKRKKSQQQSENNEKGGEILITNIKLGH